MIIAISIVCGSLLIILIAALIQEKRNSTPTPPPISSESSLWEKNIFKIEVKKRYSPIYKIKPASFEYCAVIYKNGKKVHKTDWYMDIRSAMNSAKYFIRCETEKDRKPFEWTEIKDI